jgi:hypothetical protein
MQEGQMATWHSSGNLTGVMAAVLGVALVIVTWATPISAQTLISGLSSNPDGGNPSDPLAVTACNGAPQEGALYRNSETEPYLAVNPARPSNMIAGWHQDRWSNGAAQSLGAAFTVDGGATWRQVVIPFTRCSGGLPGSTGDFERGSDPWISFGPTGTAYYMALATDKAVGENAMLVARSTDGGATWSQPTAIAHNPSQDSAGHAVFHDKNSITADPLDAHFVYATWTLFRTGFVSLVFARSADGGVTWSPARPIATMGSVDKSELAFFRQGAQIVVLPNGTLINIFYRALFDFATRTGRTEQVILRSTDRGRRWSRVDTPVAQFESASAIDPELGIPVRDSGQLPSAGVNRTTGQIYVAWQDAAANSLGAVGVFVARSDDGGLTWSSPVRVNQGTSADVQAFLPVVSVNDRGVVAVLFYDFRNDVLDDAPLSTDVYLSLFDPSLNFLSERRLTSTSFDMRQMVLTEGGYFAGDYVGLAAAGSDFVAAFTRGNLLGLPVVPPQEGLSVDTNNRQDIVFVRQSP